MKSNHEKFLKDTFNIRYYITRYLAKFDLKTQLVHGEKEEEKFY